MADFEMTDIGPQGIVFDTDPAGLTPLQLQIKVAHLEHYAEWLPYLVEKRLAKKELTRFAAELATRSIVEVDYSDARRSREEKLEKIFMSSPANKRRAS